MNRMITKCPVCDAELTVTRLHCLNCDTTIEGVFSPSSGPFSQLTPEQLQFVETFVRCEGRFNRMTDELKLSYPTLRNRLEEIIRALGYEPGKEEPEMQPARLSAEERRRILDDLEAGVINADQARRLLMGQEAQ